MRSLRDDPMTNAPLGTLAMKSLVLSLVAALLFAAHCASAADAPVRVGVFEVDASPPIGSPLAYDPTKAIDTPLSCRGIVILSAEKPIVVCAVDWIGIANGGQKLFRERLAAAAGTTPDRVAVHALHQHDAPWCDFAVDDLLASYGLRGVEFDPEFARGVIERAAGAVKKAVADARTVTHLGLGEARVQEVASNRRILGPDGKVKYVRYTATKDPKIQAFPEGVIDPLVKLIGFWDGTQPVAVLTYYATHPQSYYRTGKATPDFPGLARNARQEATGVPHIHFDGAGGNVGAGKYNDGSPAMRSVLADRVADGMRRALESVRKTPLTAQDVGWTTAPVALPLARYLDESRLQSDLEDKTQPPAKRVEAARRLVWLRRCRAGETIDLSCLRVGPARVVHMPGELFVEYQLAAQAMRPELFVAMAAYGEYAPAYIGTAIGYQQGGYETEPRSSNVAPEVEGVLLDGMRHLLDAEGKGPKRLGIEAAAVETEQARKSEGTK
ncbi:MAG: hypothetical protein P4L84_31380 [Isosphaeraceae bacterium]|nr:hypothetical protein [Isosphaeraceae bacterium]